MNSIYKTSLALLLGGTFVFAACSDDVPEASTESNSGTATETGDGDGDAASGEETDSGTQTGDGDGDSGDGDGDSGDGDGDSGDGDGDSGDGDGDSGDGDGDSGDGDGDSGDGDGDSGDGDGDSGGDGDGDSGGDGDGVCSEGCGQPNCGPCPEGPDPVMVGNYTIDSTEVTNALYEQFLDVNFTQDFYDALPAGCEFKDDFTPDEFPGNPDADLPVVNVDWCDAYAYCEWSGKELCGAIGGGATPFEDVIDWNASQWYRACTQAGIKEYPYGVLYQPNNCNTVDSGLDELADVGSFPNCEGGYAGIFDMSGNAWEWTNSCNDQDECRRRGGSFYSEGNISRCGVASIRERDYRNENLGFRCCDTM